MSEALWSWGIKFRDPYHLEQVLCHPSLGPSQFEKYEFLGDKVLGMAVTAELFPELGSESFLSKTHSLWVNKQTLALCGKLVGLDRMIRTRGIVQESTLLADGFEALIGALYLDQGLEEVRNFWARIKPHITPIETSCKTQLQEWAHKRGVKPLYQCERVGGPDHQPLFHAQLSVGELRARGRGASKKEAENAAVTEFFKLHLTRPKKDERCGVIESV